MGQGAANPGQRDAARDVVHRAAGELSSLAHHSKVHAENSLGVFRGHTDGRTEPHPRDRAGSTDQDCGRHTSYIAVSYRRGEGGG